MQELVFISRLIQANILIPINLVGIKNLSPSTSLFICFFKYFALIIDGKV